MTSTIVSPASPIVDPAPRVVWQVWTLGLCFGAPALVLAASYLWMAMDHHAAGLWNVVVHENGLLTLQGTVFYVSHFLRELPVDLSVVLFVLAGFERVQPGGRFADLPGGMLAPGLALVVAVVVMGLAFALTVRQGGMNWAFSNLLQFRTRDDVTAYGTHWRYHFLSTIWFAIAAPLAARIAVGRLDVSGPPGVSPLTWLAWGYFVAVTAVFGVSRDIFTSVLYAGHQAREIATHAAVTVPLTLGVLWLTLARGRADPAAPVWAPNREAWVRIVALLAIPAWLGVVLASGDPMSEGQSDNGLAAMVAGHFFEHVLDYVLVMLLAVGALSLKRLMRWG
jgi:hypothetical protein